MECSNKMIRNFAILLEYENQYSPIMNVMIILSSIYIQFMKSEMIVGEENNLCSFQYDIYCNSLSIEQRRTQRTWSSSPIFAHSKNIMHF